MAKNKRLVPFDPMAGDQGPVRLRIPPRECEACGGKFIPTGNRQKYCPNCSRMSPKEREAVRKMHGSPSSEVVTYIDESLKKAAAEPSDPIREEENMKETFEPIEAKPVEELEEIKDVTQSAPNAFLDALLQLIRREYGVDLIPADEYMPATLTVDGKAFSGLYIKKSTWEGIEK